MKKAYNKDIWRAICKEKKRFLSILSITALGVVMLTGLKAACVDLRTSADAFFDQQQLYDIAVLSSLGLSDSDVNMLSDVEGVKQVEGSYKETALTKYEGKVKTAEVKTMSDLFINQPKVLSGYLPTNDKEIAVTEKYLKETGKSLGDTLTLENTSNIKNTQFTITATVIDPMDINSTEGAASFRSTATTDYTFFLTKDNVIYPIYSAVYLTLTDTADMLCYSKEYEDTVAKAMDKIDTTIKETPNDTNIQENAQYYIQNRNSLSGYVNISSDASCIESVGTAFPILFFIIAILISLTTITRMVEEERGLIGTYKALGFSNREIRKKYMIYAAAACLIGSLIGNLGGFILLPNIIFTIFHTMYQLPSYGLQFEWLYGIGGSVIFIGGIMAAVFFACQTELSHTPASLMRPVAPKEGSTILLERIPFLWKHFSFLNKVTARNLFRYKKRLFMTIGGIMGCTALVLCGFAIKDSVTDLMPRQYEHIYAYDFMSIASPMNNDSMVSYVEGNRDIASSLNLEITKVTVRNEHGELENVQLIVVPNGEQLNEFIHLEYSDGSDAKIPDDGILITKNASVVLDFTKEDHVFLQDLNLNEIQIKVSGIINNYLGNNVVISQSCYERYFGIDYAPNAILANFSTDSKDTNTFIDELENVDGVISVVQTEKLKAEFSKAFSLINMVVYIIIIMAAGLAFVVLFTLATTNISERIRELSTIKVLGFYDREVHLYVNKETLLLTTIGILLGLPLGAALGHCLTYVLNMPSIYFAVTIFPVSFAYAAIISFVFAIIVNSITNRLLNRVDPVEALKSVE